LGLVLRFKDGAGGKSIFESGDAMVGSGLDWEGGAATSDGPQPAIKNTAINIALAHGNWHFRNDETGIKSPTRGSCSRLDFAPARILDQRGRSDDITKQRIEPIYDVPASEQDLSIKSYVFRMFARVDYHAIIPGNNCPCTAWLEWLSQPFDRTAPGSGVGYSMGAGPTFG